MTVNSSRNDVDDAIQALREAREREAATGEILQVLSRSRSDYGPVFDLILDRAIELCQAPFAVLFLLNGDKTQLDIVAHRGTRTRFVELMKQNPLPVDPAQSSTARALLEKKKFKSKTSQPNNSIMIANPSASTLSMSKASGPFWRSP